MFFDHIDIQQLKADSPQIANSLHSMCTYYAFELWKNGKQDLAHKCYTKAVELEPSSENYLNLAISTKEYLKDNKKYHELLLKAEDI